jgi:outer membrane protein TolC
MTRSIIVATVVIHLLVSDAGTAQAEPSAPLRLADVLAEARQRNPEILAARARATAMAAMPAQAAALDDPTLSWEAWNFPESFRIDQADNNILKLAQRLPFPGKRRLAGVVAERDADMAKNDVEGVALDVETAIKRAYYGLWLVHQNLEVYSRDKDLVQRFARIAEKKYGVGEVPQADVLRAQVEVTRLINRVTTETLAIDSARAELNALISRAPGDPLGLPEAPPLGRLDENPDRYIDLALRQRPEVGAQNFVIAREEAALRLARLNYFPDFEVSAARFQNFGAKDGFGVMASVSLPIANRGKYAAAVAEAESRIGAARAERRRLEDRIRREVAQAFLNARSARLRHELFVTTHIPQAEQALRVTESGYESGDVDFLALVDSLRAIESVHLEHYEAAADFEKSYADLVRAVAGAVDAVGGGTR